MAQIETGSVARKASLERRRALTSVGKAAIIKTQEATSTAQTRQYSTATHVMVNSSSLTGRAASKSRRNAMSSSGKSGLKSKDRTRSMNAKVTPSVQNANSKEVANSCGCGCNGTKSDCVEHKLESALSSVPTNSKSASIIQSINRKPHKRSAGRTASLARRNAMSSRGKAGANSHTSTAQTARAVNPGLSSRELAKELRETRSRQGKSGEKKTKPSGRIRQRNNETGAAQDAPWKVGKSETSRGQTLTGTMVGRSQNVTGDEPSTCRSVTGTEYLGADIFRDFCQSDPVKSIAKVDTFSTLRGNKVSGNKIGRGSNVTGDEPGSCKNVTGNEYVSTKQFETFCNTVPQGSPHKVINTETRKGKSLTGSNIGRSEKVTGDEAGAGRELTGSQYMQVREASADKRSAPAKVGVSATLRGGNVSGSMVGRSERVTGDEPGSCKNVTGDDYIGQEQYRGFCEKTPQPEDRKVGSSKTFNNKTVTGTLTERSDKVTGSEPGTCKSVTGTPYAGIGQYDSFCKAEEKSLATARTSQQNVMAGSVMTGRQPSVGGTMTGDSKGACEYVSGTPYVGNDILSQACPATAAETSSPDFPQAMGNSVIAQSSAEQLPGRALVVEKINVITGNQYEQGLVTGPFGMANGKVTGTEEARYGKDDVLRKPENIIPVEAQLVEGRVKSRITGEGINAGLKITGDDWDRGDNVTGTEGMSAIQRNPTLRAQSKVQSMAVVNKRNEEIQVPVSKVTGGSGNTEKGAVVTYTGGARG